MLKYQHQFVIPKSGALYGVPCIGDGLYPGGYATGGAPIWGAYTGWPGAGAYTGAACIGACCNPGCVGYGGWARVGKSRFPSKFVTKKLWQKFFWKKNLVIFL